MGTETRAQALRGVASAKTPQCAKARRGEPECPPKRGAVAGCKKSGIGRGG